MREHERIITTKAAQIIDLVEDAIREAHPEIEQFVPQKDEDGNLVNTLLYGEAYYNLENDVIEIIKRETGAIFVEGLGD